MLLFARPSLHALPVVLAIAAAPAAAQSPMADAGAMMDGAMTVARLSDAEASCEQLYAEATHLEGVVAAMPKPQDPAALAMKMQADMRAAQQKMIAGQRAKSIGTSLLSLVPGAGMVAGAVSSMGSRGAGTAAFDRTIEESMRAQQESAEAMMAVSRLQARQGYVTQLFVERGCKPSGLDAGAVASATAALAGSAPHAAAAPASLGATETAAPMDESVPGAASPHAAPSIDVRETNPAPAAPPAEAVAEPGPGPRHEASAAGA